ncbi:MAG TPA: hypothetical protein VIH57_02755 [Bacteroidales bacterium]
MDISKNVRVLLNMAYLLMSFIFLNHFFVLVSFLTSGKFLPAVFPMSFLTAVCLSIYKGKKDAIKGVQLFLPAIVSFLLLVFSLLFSVQFYDFSFDGQWYHQPAVYKLAGGWNTFLNPLEEAHKSILHFPKGTWYFSASVYSTLGFFEAAKCLNILMIVIAAIMVYTTSIEYKISQIKSIALSAMVTLHPVVWSELTTFQNDNNLYLNIVIYFVAILAWFRNQNRTSVLIGIMACVCLINIKFTGLLFFCVFAAFAFVYFLIWKREYLLKFIGVHSAIIVLGVLIFGFNPYVTNLIHRGNPLYPLLGSKDYPGDLSGDKDGNEKYETPKNMVGKPIYERFFYANFGSPSNAPYNNQENAELVIPFTSKVSDWKVYRFHDLRIAAFGPFYSGILILSVGFLIFLLITSDKYRWLMLLPIVAIIASLLLSKHFWWARFGPQLWLFPIILIFVSFLSAGSKFRSIFNWTLVSLIIVNGLIVLSIHLNWVHQSTNKLKAQLTEIKQQGKPIEICMGWFDKSMNHKLDDWGINYTNIPRKEFKKKNKEDFTELMSVVEGYPGINRYRVMVDNKEQTSFKSNK